MICLDMQPFWPYAHFFTFKLHQRLGKGAQGSVFLAENKLDKKMYVLKKVSLNFLIDALFYVKTCWEMKKMTAHYYRTSISLTVCVCVEKKLRTAPNGHCSEQLSIQLENHSSNVKRLHSTVVCFGVELIFLATRFVSCNVFEKFSLTVIFIQLYDKTLWCRRLLQKIICLGKHKFVIDDDQLKRLRTVSWCKYKLHDQRQSW